MRETIPHTSNGQVKFMRTNRKIGKLKSRTIPSGLRAQFLAITGNSVRRNNLTNFPTLMNFRIARKIFGQR